MLAPMQIVVSMTLKGATAPQCIAADISGSMYLQLVKHSVYASVGTSRTQDGRPCRNLGRRYPPVMSGPAHAP